MIQPVVFVASPGDVRRGRDRLDWEFWSAADFEGSLATRAIRATER